MQWISGTLWTSGMRRVGGMRWVSGMLWVLIVGAGKLPCSPALECERLAEELILGEDGRR